MPVLGHPNRKMALTAVAAPTLRQSTARLLLAAPRAPAYGPRLNRPARLVGESLRALPAGRWPRSVRDILSLLGQKAAGGERGARAEQFVRRNGRATELSAPQPGCRRADRQYSAGLLRLCWLLRRALRPFHHEGLPPPPMGCDAGQASCGETRCVADGHPAPRQGPVWPHQRAEGSPWIERPARNNAPAGFLRGAQPLAHGSLCCAGASG